MRYFAAFCVPADFTDLRLISQKHGKSGQIADVRSSQIVVKICGFTTKDFAQGCTSLTSITIPNNVTIIGSSAFEGCTSLTSITIPDEVTDIENYVFRGCDNITSITIPDSVFGIGNGVFASCSSLTSITIPDNVTLNPDNSEAMPCSFVPRCGLV